MPKSLLKNFDLIFKSALHLETMGQCEHSPWMTSKCLDHLFRNALGFFILARVHRLLNQLEFFLKRVERFRPFTGFNRARIISKMI